MPINRKGGLAWLGVSPNHLRQQLRQSIGHFPGERELRKEVIMAGDHRDFGPSSWLGTKVNHIQSASNLSKKILLVEREEPHRRSLDYQLRNDGYSVYACHKVAEAVALLEREQIDFVITEHAPRRLDGLDLLARVKQQNEKVPVLVMSSLQEKEPYIVAMNLGALDYLQEPVDYSNIQRLIKFS